jgi:short-subunit dehydrogenase
MKLKAIMIGNTDGIGLATTKRLLSDRWNVTGISRSRSPVNSKEYHHIVADVGQSNYCNSLYELVSENIFDLCIYFIGIGGLLDTLNMRDEPEIINVNFTGMVRTASIIIPEMVKAGHGHFIGLSSVADELLSAEAPSYNASKAGFSNYLEGLARALIKRGVHVTNVRFGFVDTKMAKGNFKPFMMSIEKAVDHIKICIDKKPVRYTAPKILIPLVKLIKLITRFNGK